MKTFLSFVTGICVGVITGAACIITSMKIDEGYAKGLLNMTGYDTILLCKKEEEA